MVAALEARGITATVFGEAAATMQWEAGYTDPFKVMVRREDEPVARQIIEEIRAQIRDTAPAVEWSQVDVTQPAATLASGLLCWACGHKLGGLAATATTCPGCNAEIFSDDEIPVESTTNTRVASFTERTRNLRRTGMTLVLVAMFGWILVGLVLVMIEYPRLGAFLVLFGLVVVVRKLLRRS